MLKNYKGPSNNREMLRYLVGETIKAAFQDEEGKVYLVVESGEAVVFGAPEKGSPAMRIVKQDQVESAVAKRRFQLEALVAQLGDLPDFFS